MPFFFTNVASLVVESLGRVVVADFLDGATNNLLVVEDSLGGDFAEDHDHASLRGGFASNPGVWVSRKASIDNCIRDLVADFVYTIPETTGRKVAVRLWMVVV